MKAVWFKVTCTVIAMCVFVVALVGCGSKNATPTEKTTEQTTTLKALSEEEKELSKGKVKLTIYMCGDEVADQKVVLQKVNEILEKEINATMEWNNINWSDYEAKYPLLIASGEKFDLLYTARWCFYSDLAQKNGFLPLEDLLEKYGKNIKEQLPPIAFEHAKINGKFYMIPGNNMTYFGNGYIVRGDLMKKYGMTEISGHNDFIKYLEKVKENEKNIMPYRPGGKTEIDNWRYDQFTSDFLAWAMGGPHYPMTYRTQPGAKNHRLFLRWEEHPEYKEFLKISREAFKKGLWPKDVLSNQVASTDSFVAGSSAAAMANTSTFATSVYPKVMEKNPSWEPMFFDVVKGKTQISNYTGNGMSIPVTSAYPERAMMFMNLVYKNKDLNRLICYGIEGTHWKQGEKGEYKLPEGVTADNNKYPSLPLALSWWAENENHKLPEISLWPGMEEYTKKYKETAIKPVIWATWDQTNVKGELAALKQAYDTYILPANWGLIDYEDALKKYIEACEKAGMKKVYDETEKQLKSYLQTIGVEY